MTEFASPREDYWSETDARLGAEFVRDRRVAAAVNAAFELVNAQPFGSQREAVR